MLAIRRFFKFEERNTGFKKETIGGLTTFLAMAYILPVNAFMLSEAGMPYGGVFLATALSAIIGTLIMGIWAKYPVALAPGMGVNAFFTYTVCLSYNVPWQEALFAVFISGILFLIISVTGLRRKILNAIPRNLKFIVGASIGFFIAFVGLKNAGIITSDPGTLVGLGNFGHPTVILGLFGLTLALVLFAIGGKIRSFSIIIAIAATAIVGLILGLLGVDYMPAYDTSESFFGHLKDLGDIKETFLAFMGKNADGTYHLLSLLTNPLALVIIFTFLFVDFFDTAGTLMAVGTEANLVDENGELIDGDKALLADSVATCAGSVLGTSTVTSYVESISGIESGARSGFSSVVIAFLFALSILLYPILSIVNGINIGGGVVLSPVTSMALIMIGVMMMSQLKFIDWNDTAVQVAAFFTIIFMILTFKISDGIAFGFLSYVIVKVASKKYKEVHPIMYGLSVVFIIYFVLHGLNEAGIIG